MQRAMAREAEAERERRAKVISARGELEASEQLRDASITLSESPASLQLRYLQTLLELGADQNSTVVFPIPIDIISPFLNAMRQQDPGNPGVDGNASGTHIGRKDPR
jgi:regulator of protease activity HflC (stomatin/prohibitin superfamily)